MPRTVATFLTVVATGFVAVGCASTGSNGGPSPGQSGSAGATGASASGANAGGGGSMSMGGDVAVGNAGTGGDAGGTGGVGMAGASGGEAAGAAGANPGGPFMFPDGAIAAVSLTYDDGLDPHLAIVQPALEAAGFRGTFFLSNFEGVDNDWALPSVKMPLLPLTARHMAWQAAGQKGHELADHTVNHPCNSANKAPNYHLTDYTQERMAAELDESVARLARLGVKQPITFAYPCGSDKEGIGPTGEDFSPLVAARFYAARVSDDGVADPAKVDLLHVPQLDTGGKTGDELRQMVDLAIAAKGWLTLLFHGVGTDATCNGSLAYAPDKCMINYLTTSAEAHAALVQYLVEKKSQVWTAPFGTVATRIKNSR